MNRTIVITTLLTLLVTAGCASTSEPPPSTTPDGLELVRSDKHSAVYMKPDAQFEIYQKFGICLLYTSPSPRDGLLSRMPSSA